ncbi:DUF4238 domain-containing protein [Pseudomonas viridiflava]|jgi:hypothetical protein|uniref:DUF4238 domain-containing protein n=2 Tax=Pseudomonas viridiflava TaxID=33069 RepID=UPI000F03360C|nr:DUF4238 domain-containing protein [Pseudomonas viridiflava]
MMEQQSHRHHYVPQWYQKRFLTPGAKAFKILDLKPEVYRDNLGRVRGVARDILDKGPDAWFYESELYTIRAFGEVNDDIETMLFGTIDSIGKQAVEALISEDWDKIHRTYSSFFEYMDAQRLRTPKGLAFLSHVADVKNQYELMMQMQRLRRMHCTMWGEGVVEIFSADEAEVKFIFSDHPVTFFNRFVFPQDKKVPAGMDPLQQWMGTQTIYPLSRDRLLVITHLEWARKQGEHRAVKKRTNARLFDNSIVRYDNVKRGRQLTSSQVRQVNLIIKLRAHRYIAGSNVEDLYPEKHLKTTLWSKLGLFLMPQSLQVAMEGGYTFIKMNNGQYCFQDEFGRRPTSKEEFDAKVREAEAMETHVKRLIARHHVDEAD